MTKGSGHGPDPFNSPVEPRHSEFLEEPADLRMLSRPTLPERGVTPPVLSSHPARHVVHEWQHRGIHSWRDGSDLERLVQMPGEVAGKGPPHHGNVNRAGSHRFDESRRRIGFRVVA